MQTFTLNDSMPTHTSEKTNHKHRVIPQAAGRFITGSPASSDSVDGFTCKLRSTLDSAAPFRMKHINTKTPPWNNEGARRLKEAAAEQKEDGGRLN